MKQLFAALFFLFFASSLFAQKAKEVKPDPGKKLHEVEAACGQCQLGLKGKGCTLAIRMDGKSYFVDGSDIDSHGDAHADDGFCNKIRKASVQGEVVNDRFKATYFTLLPEPEKKAGN
jgi:hypothetical protein